MYRYVLEECNKKKRRIEVYISVKLCIRVLNGPIQMGVLETCWNKRTHLHKIKANNMKSWFYSTHIDNLKHQLKFIQRYKKKCRKSGHSLWIIEPTNFSSSFYWIGIVGGTMYVCERVVCSSMRRHKVLLVFSHMQCWLEFLLNVEHSPLSVSRDMLVQNILVNCK